MINLSLKSLISKSLFHRQLKPFASKPKSYYQILQVKPNSTLKQIRGQFLKKARQLHPDHNPSQQAQQDFKLVKQAYETLKDPQRKYMYDTGISVQPGQESEMHQEFSQTGRKYYENRWYQYEKSKHKDARDQFYEKRTVIIDEENPLRSKVIMFVLLVIGFFGYDYYYSKIHKKQAENIMAKQLIENSLQNKKKTIIMKKYIQARAIEHKVQQ